MKQKRPTTTPKAKLKAPAITITIPTELEIENPPKCPGVKSAGIKRPFFDDKNGNTYNTGTVLEKVKKIKISHKELDN